MLGHAILDSWQAAVDSFMGAYKAAERWQALYALAALILFGFYQFYLLGAVLFVAPASPRRRINDEKVVAVNHRALWLDDRFRMPLSRHCFSLYGFVVAALMAMHTQNLVPIALAASLLALDTMPTKIRFIFGLVAKMFAWTLHGVAMVWLFFRLALFSMILLPGLLRVACRYACDPRIQCRRFGPGRRQFVDIYLPTEAGMAAQNGGSVPVVFAVMGGAFVIGHRAWNAQFGLRLMDAGVIVVAVDYRNYPLGTVPDMVSDLDAAMVWVHANVGALGGDMSRMVILAQSAGAHLAAMLLLERSLQVAKSGPPSSCIITENVGAAGWSPKSLRGFVGVSGPYDLIGMGPHLATRGLNAEFMSLICGGDVARCSPSSLLQSEAWQQHGKIAAAHLPPIVLFHGAEDKTVPAWNTHRFGEALRRSGASVTADVRQGLAHTDPVIECPIRGEDIQVELVLPLLLGDRDAAASIIKGMAPMPVLMPRSAVQFARRVVPF